MVILLAELSRPSSKISPNADLIFAIWQSLACCKVEVNLPSIRRVIVRGDEFSQRYELKVKRDFSVIARSMATKQ